MHYLNFNFVNYSRDNNNPLKKVAFGVQERVSGITLEGVDPRGDNGIIVERTDDDGFVLTFSIPDTSEYIPIGSPEDLLLVEKGLSNPDLRFGREEIFSEFALDTQGIKKTVSFKMKYSKDFQLEEVLAFPSEYENIGNYNFSSFWGFDGFLNGEVSNIFDDLIKLGSGLYVKRNGGKLLDIKGNKSAADDLFLAVHSLGDFSEFIGDDFLRDGEKELLAGGITKEIRLQVNKVLGSIVYSEYKDNGLFNYSYKNGSLTRNGIPANASYGLYVGNKPNSGFHSRGTNSLTYLPDYIGQNIVTAIIKKQERPYTRKNLRALIIDMNKQLAVKYSLSSERNKD